MAKHEKHGDIAIASSGDPAEDARRLERFQLHETRMAANICPNGCGPMEWDDPHTRHCLKCGFVGWSSTPHTEGSA